MPCHHRRPLSQEEDDEDPRRNKRQRTDGEEENEGEGASLVVSDGAAAAEANGAAAAEGGAVAVYRYAIKMRGLPWQANTAMVQEFFNGISLPVDAITIMHDSSGSAYVYLANEKEANDAMRFNRQNMGRR